MEFVYEEDACGALRPVAGILFYSGGALLSQLPVKCLLDTGSAHTFLRWELADELGIDLGSADDYGLDVSIGLGGKYRSGIKVVDLGLEVFCQQATGRIQIPSIPVLFVKDELPFTGILGASALRYLAVVFREYEGLANVRPAEDFYSDECPHFNGGHPL
ncbi:MAG: retropepsin-like domain-containing protein [Coriobacteriia bacterium]|nr:retropepsin-like domain-containing protein [Coriobacteriia bacterium]